MTSGDDQFRRWLESLGLAMHAQAFADNDVRFDVLRYLSDADLKELGLSLGHRRILLAAIDRLRAGTQPGPGALPDPAGQGERRQITVMFCDLVDSTALTARLGPEHMFGLTRAYLGTCSRSIQQAGGFVARLIGDGILAYFGYPAAREDAAECAIRAGLAIIDALAAASLEGGQRLEVRIGLATGLSVVGDLVGSGFAELHAVMGQTPNLAARIQALAPPGTLAIADDTRRLAGDVFVYADLGWHAVKGLAQPVHVQRVVGEALASVRFDAHRTQIFDCLGRDAELAALLQAWRRARQGRLTVVAVIGEAGIGKSRLLRAASERIAAASGRCALLQCSPHQATTPLHPVVAWIRRETGVAADQAAANRERLAAWLGDAAAVLDLALLADLLGVPVSGAQELPAMPPDRKRNLTRELVLRHLERRCDAGAVLLLLEDAHWMDGATEDFLKSLFRSLRERPLLALVTSRNQQGRDWGAEVETSCIALEPLGRADAERLVLNACRGLRLPAEVVGQILAKTDGVPLFIEELTATVLESGKLRAQGDALVVDGPLPTLAIPSTLHDSLMARLDRLRDAKEVARVGSALGRDFSFAMLARVCGHAPARLQAALGRLVDAQLLFQRGEPPAADYTFKHALVQQAAYEGQLQADRQALHARIVEAMEAHQPDVARREPGLMAHHCHQAALVDKEVDYLYAAGLASTRMVAIPEALSYFTRAEETVAGLEPTARNVARRIDIILGMMEVGRFAILPGRLMELGARARRLAGSEGVRCDAQTLSAILFQEGRAHLYTSRYDEARRIFEQIRQLGREQGSVRIEMKPASAFAMNLCCQGRFQETLDFINEGNVDAYKEAGSSIDYIAGLGWIGYARCETGPGEDGLRFGELSVREAEQVQSQIYLGGAHVWRSHALMALRRHDEAVADARRCIAISDEHAVPYLGWHGRVFLALCLARGGAPREAAAALAEARALLAQVQDGQWSLTDYVPAIEAEIACFEGEHERAVAAAERAIEIAGPIGGHFAEAMAWRVKAVSCLRTGGDADRAQACFDNALRLWARGGARAERAFAALVWAQALDASGFIERARLWAQVAREHALRHGFALARCEYGAAAML